MEEQNLATQNEQNNTIKLPFEFPVMNIVTITGEDIIRTSVEGDYHEGEPNW